MYRKPRRNSRPFTPGQRVDSLASAIEKAMDDAGISTGDRGRFVNWAVNSLWNTFKEQRMRQRVIIENEIKSLGIHLPNGTVKKSYSASFTLPLNKVSNPVIEGVRELGLDFKVEPDGKINIFGNPVIPGDFSLTLRYATVEGEELSELKIPIAFNQDPRGIWNDIPTDPNIRYYKPDCAGEYIKPEAEKENEAKKCMIAASKRGRSHAHKGSPRDDDFALLHCKDSDWYVLAVADGAGSAKYSRKGSEIACATIIDHCKGLLSDNPAFEEAIRAYHTDRDDAEKRTALTRHVIDIIYKGALNAHEAIKKASEEAGDAKIRDFATTLMFAICKKFDFGWFIASFWVGDGAMCIYDETNQTAKLLGTPDEGEFSGQTRFLTMREIFHDKDIVTKRMRMAIVPDFTALFLMTDGVSDPMFETEKNLKDFSKWSEFYRNLQAGFPEDEIGGVDLKKGDESRQNQLLNWLNFWSPGNHDDRTIAILC